MEKQEFRTQLNQRVRLRGNGEDGMYSLATAGSEGWVRERKLDNLGYPLVKIEWDRHHWAYNGEPDKWTFEAHFDPIEEKLMSDQNSDSIADIVAAVVAQLQGGKEVPGISAAPPETAQSVLEDLRESVKCQGEAGEPHAYILITLEELEKDVWNPHVHSRYASAEAGRVLELYLAKLGFLSYQDLVNAHLSKQVDTDGA